MAARNGIIFKSGMAIAIMGAVVLAAAHTRALAGQAMGPDVVVSYADLDITTAAGAEQLYERIQHAAARICPQADSLPLASYAASVHCRNAVVNQAVSKVGSPKLSAVYASRAHRAAHSPV